MVVILSELSGMIIYKIGCSLILTGLRFFIEATYLFSLIFIPFRCQKVHVLIFLEFFKHFRSLKIGKSRSSRFLKITHVCLSNIFK